MFFSNLVLTSVLLGSSVMSAGVNEGVIIESRTGEVSNVTLYRNQAMVTRTIDINAGPGNSEVVIGDLPENVIADSLFAEGSAGIEVRAVQFRTRAVGESPREEVRQLQEQIVLVQDKIQLCQKNSELANSRALYLDQLEQTVAPEDPSDLSLEATDLERMTLFLFEQRELIAPKQIELAKEQRDLKQQLNLLQRQLGEITNGATKTVREAVLFVTKADDSPQQVRLNYLVNNCGWSPTYTIRSEENWDDAKLDYNGLIYQMSGEDWSNVSLTLSTASPALSAAAPGLAPLRVTLVQSGKGQALFQKATKMQIGEIVSKQQAALRGNLNATNLGDFNESNWSINEAADQWACVELVGDSRAVDDLRTELGSITQQPSLTYQLQNKVTLKSRNNRQMVRIVSTSLPSQFYHVATPVLSNYVYREAELTNDSSEDLLAGPISVYLGDKFVGRGEIPTVARGQTFVVGFGADPQLRTRRELVEKKDGINGGNRELKFDYRLVVENFKNEAVEIRLIDRMPTSMNNANIRITQNDFSTHLSDDKLYQRVEKPEGILRWEISVPANATVNAAHVIEYSYTVEYDRKFVVSLPGSLNQQKREFEQLQKYRTVR